MEMQNTDEKESERFLLIVWRRKFSFVPCKIPHTMGSYAAKANPFNLRCVRKGDFQG